MDIGYCDFRFGKVSALISKHLRIADDPQKFLISCEKTT